MPFAKGLGLTTLREKKNILFCITIHQHTILACTSVRHDNDMRKKREQSEWGTLRVKDSI